MAWTWTELGLEGQTWQLMAENGEGESPCLVFISPPQFWQVPLSTFEVGELM